MGFSDHAETVNEWLMQVREFRQLISEVEDFPLQYFYDVRESIVRIRIENTHLEENELFDLRRSLSTIESIVKSSTTAMKTTVMLKKTTVGAGRRNIHIQPCTAWQKT